MMPSGRQTHDTLVRPHSEKFDVGFATCVAAQGDPLALTPSQPIPTEVRASTAVTSKSKNQIIEHVVVFGEWVKSE